MSASPIPKGTRRKLYNMQKGRCFYCGGSFGGFKSGMKSKLFATIDHIHPVSEGGSNDFENLVLACPKCNVRKGNDTTHVGLILSIRKIFYERTA